MDKLGIADCFQEMGLLCYNQKDQHRARGFFGQAQRLVAETNDKVPSLLTVHIVHYLYTYLSYILYIRIVYSLYKRTCRIYSGPAGGTRPACAAKPPTPKTPNTSP